MHFFIKYLYIIMIVLFPLSSIASIKKVFDAPNDIKIAIKEISPITRETDLQIIILLKNNPGSDKYLQAMNYFNGTLGGLLSALREQGEFMGDLGETMIFIPPSDSDTPKKVLLVGLGDEEDFTLGRLKVAGRIAAREAVRLQAKKISFAPILREQKDQLIEIGERDAAIVEQVILAYDTEKRLQTNHLAPNFDITEWTIEIAPMYFTSIVKKVDDVLKSTSLEVNARSLVPLVEKKISAQE